MHDLIVTYSHLKANHHTVRTAQVASAYLGNFHVSYFEGLICLGGRHQLRHCAGDYLCGTGSLKNTHTRFTNLNLYYHIDSNLNSIIL